VDQMNVTSKDQLDATVTIYRSPRISLTCSGQLFAHLQERKTEIYSMWYSVLVLW